MSTSRYRFFAGLFMFIVVPYLASKLTEFVIKTPVSLKVTYFGGALLVGQRFAIWKRKNALVYTAIRKKINQ